MAFITDVRRGNLHLQLMYKALFEMSKDRADFVSRLFTKPRPAGLTDDSRQSLRSCRRTGTSTSSDQAAFEKNLQALRTHSDQDARSAAVEG